MELGQYLRNIRKNKKMSLNYVHKKTGITNSRMHRIEIENKEPPVSDLIKLANLYDISFISLLKETRLLDGCDNSNIFNGTDKLSIDEIEIIQSYINILLKYKKEELL